MGNLLWSMQDVSYLLLRIWDSLDCPFQKMGDIQEIGDIFSLMSFSSTSLLTMA